MTNHNRLTSHEIPIKTRSIIIKTREPMRILCKSIFCLIVCFYGGVISLQGQEIITPLQAASRTLMPPKNIDTLSLTLPFFDDFSNYQGLPDNQRWLSSSAFINRDYGTLPPTLGVATLDALDAEGNLYSNATTSIFSADTLVSQRIRLDSVFLPYRKSLQPVDSVYLSFYYLPGGGFGNMWERVGDAPEEMDSLFLEFYNSTDTCWTVVWAIGGITVDSLLSQTGNAWQYVTIPIFNTSYFNRYFQFRFRNYCSLDNNPKLGMVGNTDQWNIDYVYIDYNRNYNNHTFRDVAFVNKAPSMLTEYQAMPARQFMATDMASTISMTITNLYSQTLATEYFYDVYNNATGANIAHYDGGYENAPTYAPNNVYQTAAAHATPQVNFSYPISNEQGSYRVVHVVHEGVSGDAHTANDTVVFDQVFSNYYAYDDGVPENGYGLTTTGGKMYLAYTFSLNQIDTLTAVDLYFNKTRNNENAGIKFHLCVWQDNNGTPGTLIYRNSTNHIVSFDSLNQYVRYRFDAPIVVDGKIYVGFEQTGTDYINLGFDRNNDASNKIFYRTSNQWQQSILRGALMLRPCFGQSALVSITDVPQNNLQMSLYPNPTYNMLNIDIKGVVPADKLQMQVFNMHGRCLYNGAYQQQLSVIGYSAGIYVLRLSDNLTGKQSVNKFIISK